GFLNLSSGTRPAGDAERILLTSEVLLVGIQRKDDPVVQRVAERRTLLLSCADDFAGNVVPANFLADRVKARHEVLDQIVANHANRCRAAHVGFGYVTP